MPEEAQPLQPTSARAYKESKKPRLVRISNKLVVLMKPIDMTEAFFNNLIPLPAVGAKNKFDELQKKLEDAQATGQPAEALKVLEGEGDFMEVLKRYASAAVIEPKVVVGEENYDKHLAHCNAGEDEICAHTLSRMELVTIFNESEGTSDEPVVSPDKVADFRGTAGEPTEARELASVGEGIRSEAFVVDRGDRETYTA